jgi:four helix bundle protein
MGKKYDLEERTYTFAKHCRILVNKFSYSVSNREDSKQLVRSSGSIGANYIEANEALSKKDFLYRIKVSRKEAKESKYWLRLLKVTNVDLEQEIEELITESDELRKILSAIINSSEQ